MASGVRWLSMPCLALAALGACGDDAQPAPVEASDFCEEYVDVVCQGLASCCDEVMPYNDANCRRQQVDVCNNGILTLDDRGLAPGGANAPARIVFDFDEAGAARALNELRRQLARCSGDGVATMFDETHFLGEPGAECLRNADCVEGARCEHPPRAVFGTCVRAPLEGQRCEDVCATRELSCVQDEAEHVCVALRKEGQSCDLAPCADGLVCAVSSASGAGAGSDKSCMRARRLGESCAADGECESSYCHDAVCADDGATLAGFCGSFGLESLQTN